MLIGNLDPRRGLLNGTRLVVKKLHQYLIEAKIIMGNHLGETTLIPRIILEPTDVSIPFKLRRRQFPIIPAFALTINKCQGQSFKQVGVFLNEPVFSHGQLYVALSRCKQKNCLRVSVAETLSQGNLLSDGRIFTKNPVIKELLL